MSLEDVRDAASTAVVLISNTNVHILRLRREKYVSSINKDLAPLVKEDADFADAAPNLFGADFSKRAKEHLDQVKSLRRYSNPTRYRGDHSRRPFFRKGFSSGRGTAKGRGRAPTSVSHRPSHACCSFNNESSDQTYSCHSEHLCWQVWVYYL